MPDEQNLGDATARPHIEDLAIDFTAFVIKRFNDEDLGWSQHIMAITEEFETDFNGLTGRFMSDNLVLMSDSLLEPLLDGGESEFGRRLLFRYRVIFVADYATEEVKNPQQVLNAMVAYIDDTINPKYVASIDGFSTDLPTEFFNANPLIADKLFKLTPHFVELQHTVLSNNLFTCEIASLFDWKLEFKVEHALEH